MDTSAVVLGSVVGHIFSIAGVGGAIAGLVRMPLFGRIAVVIGAATIDVAALASVRVPADPGSSWLSALMAGLLVAVVAHGFRRMLANAQARSDLAAARDRKAEKRDRA